MNFYSLFVIALALSLDAFGVALCVGLNNGTNLKLKAMVVASSGFFQFLFSLIGVYAGFIFNTYVASMPQIVGGALIGAVGIMMLKEGMSNKDKCYVLKPWTIIVLGVSVSIDAMVIGFTAFNNVKGFLPIFINTFFIGLVTLVVTSVAFVLSKHLRKIEIVSKYADYIGGVILILFGIKMMLS